MTEDCGLGDPAAKVFDWSRPTSLLKVCMILHAIAIYDPHFPITRYLILFATNTIVIYRKLQTIIEPSTKRVNNTNTKNTAAQ